jgi:hypothetical protein
MEEFKNTGWFCTRPTKSVDRKSAVCPTDYNDIGDDKCKKECAPGYDFINEKCVQKCPENTINNTDTTCKREKTIRDDNETELPYKYRIKKEKLIIKKKIV